MRAVVINSFESAETRFNGLIICATGTIINRRRSSHQVYDSINQQCTVIGGNGEQDGCTVYFNHSSGCMGKLCRCLDIAAAISSATETPLSLTPDLVQNVKATLGTSFHLVISTRDGVSSVYSDGDHQRLRLHGHGQFKIM
jgi:hypothetical protein